MNYMLAPPSFRPPEPRAIHLVDNSAHPPAFSTQNTARPQPNSAGADGFSQDPFGEAVPMFDTAAIVTWGGQESDAAVAGTAANAARVQQRQNQGQGQTYNSHDSPYHPTLTQGYKNQLQKVHHDEFLLALRKRTIARFGALWLRPPGVTKTLQGMEDERLERAEAQILRARELAMEEGQRAMALAGPDADAMGEDGLGPVDGTLDASPNALVEDYGAEPLAAEGMEDSGMRDLDDDVPDLDAEGGGFGDWSDDDDDDDNEGSEEEDELNPGDSTEHLENNANQSLVESDADLTGEILHEHAFEDDLGELGLGHEEAMMLATGGRQSVGLARHSRNAMMQDLGLEGVMAGPEGEGDGDYSHPELFSPSTQAQTDPNRRVMPSTFPHATNHPAYPSQTLSNPGGNLFTPAARAQGQYTSNSQHSHDSRRRTGSYSSQLASAPSVPLPSLVHTQTHLQSYDNSTREFEVELDRGDRGADEISTSEDEAATSTDEIEGLDLMDQRHFINHNHNQGAPIHPSSTTPGYRHAGGRPTSPSTVSRAQNHARSQRPSPSSSAYNSSAPNHDARRSQARPRMLSGNAMHTPDNHDITPTIGPRSTRSHQASTYAPQRRARNTHLNEASTSRDEDQHEIQGNATTTTPQTRATRARSALSISR